MNCKDGSIRRSNRPEIVLASDWPKPVTLIGQPTHRPSVQAAYHWCCFLSLFSC